MNAQQLEAFKSEYCEMIIDGMDMDCLVQMCHDLLMDAYKDSSYLDVRAEVLDLYDEEMLADLLSNVPAE